MLLYILMLIIQTILAIPRRLRRKGLYFYGVGFAIRISIDKKSEPKRRDLSIPEMLLITNAIIISVVSTVYFIIFVDELLSFKQTLLSREIFKIFLELVNRISLPELYVFAWTFAATFGLFHEYLHIRFGKIIGIPIRNIYIATLLGFPLLFSVETDTRGTKNIQRAFVAAGGLIANTIYLSVMFILFFLFPANIWIVVVFYVALIITIINGLMINIIDFDGLRISLEVARSYGEKGFAGLILVWFIILAMFVIRPLII